MKKVAVAAISLTLMIPAARAIEPTQVVEQVLASEGGTQMAKEALNSALKVACSKPAMALASTIACGILLSKTLG